MLVLPDTVSYGCGMTVNGVSFDEASFCVVGKRRIKLANHTQAGQVLRKGRKGKAQKKNGRNGMGNRRSCSFFSFSFLFTLDESWVGDKCYNLWTKAFQLQTLRWRHVTHNQLHVSLISLGQFFHIHPSAFEIVRSLLSSRRLLLYLQRGFRADISHSL